MMAQNSFPFGSVRRKNPHPIVGHHYNNIKSGKVAYNRDGTTSSIRTIIVGMSDKSGTEREYLIPTVWDGKVLDENAAKKRALETGIYEVFPNVSAAKAYDDHIHRVHIKQDAYRTPLDFPSEEAEFQGWYRGLAKEHGLSTDPDAPAHFYDYRGAFKSGRGPDASGHWASRFKDAEHPARYVREEGMPPEKILDTKSGFVMPAGLRGIIPPNRDSISDIIFNR